MSAREVEEDFHQSAIPDGALWGQVTRKPTNIGAGITKALGRIEQANPDRLAGIFGDAAWGNKERLPEANLINLIDVLDGVPPNPDAVSNDLLGTAYEYLLRDFADESGKKAGEFFTPGSVVRLLVRILDPQQGESIYDPAAGSGGMLVETINTVREHGGDIRTLNLFGQEVNLSTAESFPISPLLSAGIATRQGNPAHRRRKSRLGSARFRVVDAAPWTSARNVWIVDWRLNRAFGWRR